MYDKSRGAISGGTPYFPPANTISCITYRLTDYPDLTICTRDTKSKKEVEDLRRLP